MQTATKDGLRDSISSTEDADFKGSDVQVLSRCTIKCIHNLAKETTGKGLVDLVATKTLEEMHDILEKPDVFVTNAKDKETMLPRILEYNEYVIQGFKIGFKKLQHTDVVPAGYVQGTAAAQHDAGYVQGTAAAQNDAMQGTAAAQHDAMQGTAAAHARRRA
jgi:hypothetical protein